MKTIVIPPKLKTLTITGLAAAVLYGMAGCASNSLTTWPAGSPAAYDVLPPIDYAPTTLATPYSTALYRDSGLD